MTATKEKTYFITLTEAELDRFQDALDEVSSLIGNAGSICDVLYVMVLDDQPLLNEMTGFLDFASRGFREAQAKEGATISDLSSRLSHLKSVILNKRRAEALAGGPRRTSTEGGHDDD